MKKERKPKGYWDSLENCEREVRAVAEREKWTEVPPSYAIDGVNWRGVQTLGGREGIGKLLGLPVNKLTKGRPKHANIPKAEKWDGKPSRAFEIEAEARKVGLSYADIQKQKTLELVGGVSV